MTYDNNASGFSFSQVKIKFQTLLLLLQLIPDAVTSRALTSLRDGT